MDHRVRDAIKDVTRVFPAPTDILGATHLTLVQKITLLRQWEYDLRLMLVASDENMADDTRAVGAAGDEHEAAADQLAAVQRCLAALGADAPLAGASAKSG